jgi:hypothetical protein
VLSEPTTPRQFAGSRKLQAYRAGPTRDRVRSHVAACLERFGRPTSHTEHNPQQSQSQQPTGARFLEQHGRHCKRVLTCFGSVKIRLSRSSYPSEPERAVVLLGSPLGMDAAPG